MNVTLRDVSIPKNWERSGLPAWTYHSEAMLELERREVFLNHWQIIGHVSNMPGKGDYLAMDIGPERAMVVRGADGIIRGFHNLCRHRGSRVVADNHGTCNNALVCPFHGWVYNLDGTLRGAARPHSFSEFNKRQFGLKPIETEIWQGFVFIRFSPGPQPSVADVMAPFTEEFGHYRSEEMIPAGDFWTSISPVNWKSVRDVDNEGYHVAMAHPALQDLYGSTYFDEPMVNGVNRSFATFNPHAGRRWSVRNYVKMTPVQPHLPERLQKAWVYYGMFPNAVLVATPETIQFYQEFPLATDRTLLRSCIYRFAREERNVRLSRYLASRIDRDTTAEDIQLTIWSNESMKSSAFEGFHLSDLEYGVRAHHDHLRARLPVMTVSDRPPESEIAALNDQMKRN